MHQWLHLRHVNQGGQFLFTAMAEQVLKQLRLPGLHQLRHSDSGVDIRHRVMGVAVFNAVCAGQMFKTEAGQPIFIVGPDDPFRAQGIACAHNVQQIPARVLVLPTPGIGIVEVAVKNMPGHFVIEAHVVVAHHAGVGHGKQVMNATGELCFIHPFFTGFLRGDAGDHHCAGLRQIVIGGFAPEYLRLTDDIEISIGAYRGKLGRAIQRGAGAKGFVVVE